MEKKNSISSLIALHDLHTGLFPNVIDGISDKDAHNRLNTPANHVAWLTNNMVQLRLRLADVAGVALDAAQKAFLDNFKSIQDGVTYPPLADYKKDWDKITPALRDKLASLTEEQLDEMVAIPGMGDKEKLSGIIGFFIYMESYGIGQIGLWRRLLGYPAMKYPGQ
ncbi:DinB family protein [Chitinophaga lutea]|uniref:DinB family protein n=1 Tax=Chitinophaga lutea TaxID=2488634 RepID=A0A3N4PKJ1_9BACT|nr:DinB family protein [Chitinophaga lutea]RPE08325.1 DinB family protein [Chitinophaga lutea]